MASAPTADVIVIGLGAMGSAGCWQLAARGASVIGIDQHEPPHPYGSTHGETRVTRLAIGEGAEYVPLVRRSHELWREIERRTGTRLLTECGGLYLGEPDSGFLRQTRDSARRYGLELESLSNAELGERYPMFSLGPRTEGYYEPTAGYVRPEAGVQAQLGLAREAGAELRLGERVLDWEASTDGVRVRTDADLYEARQLLLCAGPWTPQLFPEGDQIFAVYRQLLYWFPIREWFDALDQMPIFVWELGGQTDGFVHLAGFYGFPPLDGRDGGVKIATESYERTTVPDGAQHPATSDEIAAMYRHYVAARLPWLGAEPLRTVSCLYTSTRGSRFVIDRHPEHERVLIVSACSGHGFKHSPAIGEAVAQWLTTGTPELDLSPFGLSRALR